MEAGYSGKRGRDLHLLQMLPELIFGDGATVVFVNGRKESVRVDLDLLDVLLVVTSQARSLSTQSRRRRRMTMTISMTATTTDGDGDEGDGDDNGLR